MTSRLTSELSAMAAERGARFGVADAAPFASEAGTLLAHRASGRSGPLRFTYDDPAAATDVTVSFPWARRLVVLAWDYMADSSPPAPRGAVVGRFATADHYRALTDVASRVAARLRADGHQAEVLIDDNRLVDRAAAIRAGIGWRGKSTMVLAPGVGPWMLLGSVVTDADLDVDDPMRRECGTCIACVPACPTGAIDDEGLDARRCLSTWLQTAGSIPHWIRPHLGRRVYGCDDCLVSCPPGSRSLAAAGDTAEELPFSALLAMGDDDLLARFAWWYVPRRQGRFIRRNLLVAAGNSGEAEARQAIETHLTHASSMIRGHAAWAFARAFPRLASDRLGAALDSEGVLETRDELVLALMMAERPGRYRSVLAADETAHLDPSVRGLALVGPTAEGGDGEPDLVFVRRNRDVGLGQPLVRVYDPDRLLERARRESA